MMQSRAGTDKGGAGPHHDQHLDSHHSMRGSHADQGCQDAAILQPQVSTSSPTRHRSKASSDALAAHAAVAASADMADLVRDLNALSARCQASEQQLARARRELCKERQRSRQLRASYSDALTLLGQHKDSPAGRLPAVTSAHPDSMPAVVQAAQPGSASSSEEQGLFAANHHPACLPQASRYTARAPAQSMQAGAAAGRYHRGSTTDTAVAADQRSSGSSSDAASRAAAASSAQQTSPSKRVAAAQQQPGVGAACCGSGDAAGGSPPKKHKQAAPGQEPVNDSKSNSNQHHPYGPPRPQPLTTQGVEGDDAGAAAAAGGACDSNTRQQTRLLSKRPAQRFSPDPLAPDNQPLVRAARRLRTSDGSSDRSSNGSSSSKQSGNTSPAYGGVPPGAAAGAGIAAATAGQEGVARPNVWSDTAAPLQQPAVVDRSPANSSRAAAGQPGEVPPAAVQNRSAGLPPAPYPAPTVAPAPSSLQPGSGDGGCAHASSSSQRRSRLSAVTDGNALALVPVSTMRSSHDSRFGGAAAAQRQHSRAAERMFDIPEPEPEPEAAEPAARGGSSSSSKGSYRRKAAKAAQALARTLKNMFITATTSSSSSSNRPSGTERSNGSHVAAPAGSSDGGSGSNDGGSSRASRLRDADFRRSWQGPFFSSGSAAGAAAAATDAHRQSKDNSHTAAEGRKGSSSAGRRWKPPKWVRKYSGYSSSNSSSEDEADSVFDQHPFGPTFSPLRHNFSKHNPPHPSQQGSAAGAASGPGQSPFSDPFGPAFSPLRQSMNVQPNQQQGGRQQQEAAAGDDGFGPGWLGID